MSQYHGANVRVAIHQPEFFPWLGFFYKMALADQFVALDHVQYKRRYFENRNKVVSPSGKMIWLLAPVLSKNKFLQPINQVEINEDVQWRRKLLNSIRCCYSKAKYFKKYYPQIESIIAGQDSARLINLNMSVIQFFRDSFGINCPVSHSSSLLDENDAPTGSELIQRLCEMLKANSYLCGPSGKDYLDMSSFHSAGISVEWINFKHPLYSQLSDGFHSHLSSLDLLMSYGEKSAEIMMNSTITSGVG